MSENQIIGIGDEVLDSVTGIKGIVIVRHDYLHGVSRVGVQPTGSFEGKPHEALHMDILQAELVTAQAVSRKGTQVQKEIIPMGAKGKCKITGFTGICVSRAEWLYACTKVLLQPQGLVPKTGQPIESLWLDEGGVELVEEAKPDIVESKRTTGGFSKSTSDKSFKVSK